MTRLAVGRPWKDATDKQKSKLIDSFNRLLINSYAAAFSNYLGIVIEVGSQKLTANVALLCPKLNCQVGRHLYQLNMIFYIRIPGNFSMSK